MLPGYPTILECSQAKKVRKITKSASELLPHGPTHWIWSGTDGVINFVDTTGHLCEGFPVVRGINPIIAIQVKEGGTADDLWAFY